MRLATADGNHAWSHRIYHACILVNLETDQSAEQELRFSQRERLKKEIFCSETFSDWIDCMCLKLGSRKKDRHPSETNFNDKFV